MSLEKSLERLGLQKNTVAVYLALLTQGLSKAGPLIKATQLHRMLVYGALEDLENRGLVTTVHKNNVKMFQATDPSALIDQTKKLNELAQDLLPELRDLQQKQSSVVNVRTLIGREGFRTNLEDIIESAARQKHREICIIGGAKDSDFYDAIEDWYPTYINLLEKKKVSKRLLAPASYSAVFKKKFTAEKNTELRTLSKGLSSPSYTRITKEMVAIEMYHPQLVVIQIRNNTIAQAYLDSFELLWDAS